MLRFISNQYLCLSLLLVTGFAGLSAHAQLVNIESRRMQTDSIRFALMADMNFNYSDQSGETYFAVGTNLTTQFKSWKCDHIFFLMGSANLVRAEGTDFQNSWFLHGRYNRKFSEIFRVEAFVQYQKNQLLIIDSRFLTGGGIRLKFINEKQVKGLKGYFGNAIMYEIEDSQAYNQQNRNLRNTSYISLTYSPGEEGEEKVHLVNTFYFQPLYTAISNHRILEQFLVELPFSKVLSSTLTFNYSLISVTPAGTRENTSNVLFGFRYTFPTDL